MLEELAVGDTAVELSVVQEVVVAPVLLAWPPRSRRCRDRDLEVVPPVEQLPDQRALAGAGRAGDDEELCSGQRDPSP
jgi:hypothetical protein